METEQTTIAPKGTAQRELEAFFGLSRKRLYLFGLLGIALIFAFMFVAMLLARVDGLIFVLPIVTGTAAVIAVMLNKTESGRGCLRAFTRTWGGLGTSEPATAVRIAVVVSVLTFALALLSILV